MKKILEEVVGKLFEEIPFSKKEELLKKEVTEKLLEKYADSLRSIQGADRIDGKVEYDTDAAEVIDSDVVDEKRESAKIVQAGKLIAACGTLEGACQTVGCDMDVCEEVQDAKDRQNTKNRQDTKAVMRKAKWFLYLQSFCIVMILEQVIGIGLHFSFGRLISNMVFAGVWSAVLKVVLRRKQEYLTRTHYEDLKYDEGGRDYILRENDRYSKRFLNTWMLVFAGIAYVGMATGISIVSSMYSFAEVREQLSYMSFIIAIIVYLHLKNYFCKRLTDTYFVPDRFEKYRKQILVITEVSAGYFVIAAVLLCVFHNRISYIYNWVLAVEIIYVIMCLGYNLTMRSALVFQNITWNAKRFISVALVLTLLISYKMMSMDLFLTQPYINQIAKVDVVSDEIDYDEPSGVFTITTDKEDFQVLQLTDIHLGGSVLSVSKDLKALKACYALISFTKPDLVIVTGDLVFPMGIMSFSVNNSAPIMQFANFMRNTGIPWAFTYGNHDTESMATLDRQEFDSLMKTLSWKSSGNLLYPYIQPDIYGRSNQVIEVRNTDGSLRQALFLLDSNDYMAGAETINEYDYIHDDQVAWYKRQVLQLSEEAGYTVPSMAFFHMPLREYKTADELYEGGNDAVTYYYGELGEKMIDKICCSKYESRLFDTAVELGSTKAMFCGHDHYNNQSLEYEGIRLTYGYSIDYLAMPGIEEDVEQRGGTLITLQHDGQFDITPYRLMDIEG